MLPTLLLITISTGTAPGTAPGTGAAPPGPLSILQSPLIPIILVFVVFYFFMISSQRKQKKERANMLTSLRKGDSVMMNGGELGKIVDLDDKTVLIKVDETNNTKIRYSRDAVLNVTDRKDGEKAAEKGGEKLVEKSPDKAEKKD